MCAMVSTCAVSRSFPGFVRAAAEDYCPVLYRTLSFIIEQGVRGKTLLWGFMSAEAQLQPDPACSQPLAEGRCSTEQHPRPG